MIVEPRLLEHRLGQKLEGRPFTRKSPVTLKARADPRGWSRCQSNVANCQDKHRSKDYSFMIMTLQEIEERMDELSRRLVETHDKKIIKELYDLALELEKVEKLEKQ